MQGGVGLCKARPGGFDGSGSVVGVPSYRDGPDPERKENVESRSGGVGWEIEWVT